MGAEKYHTNPYQTQIKGTLNPDQTQVFFLFYPDFFRLCFVFYMILYIFNPKKFDLWADYSAA